MSLLSEEKRKLLALRLRQKGIAAGHLEGEQGIPRRDPSQPARLSFAQQRLWVLDQLEPGNPFYNISGVAELRGALDVAVLARAFAEIARRHESLRTTFAAVDGRPFQVVAPPPNAWHLPVIDLEGLSEDRRRSEVERLARAEGAAPCDLARGPLVRTALLRLAEREHVLLLTLHHIISDGWSNGLFLREMAALYEAFAARRPSPLPELPIQYADFAEWQLDQLQGERLDKELAWWRQALAGAPAALELPADRPRPASQTYRGARLPLWVPPAVTAGLHRLARVEEATLYMVLLAAFDIVLRHWTGQDDLSVGSPVANRRRPEIEGLIGFFANTLVLRTDLSGGPSIRTLLGRAREASHGAFAHQDLPFEKLVEDLQPERDLSRTPLFQVMLALQNAPPADAVLSTLELRRPEIDPGVAKFDLMLDLTEIDGGLLGALEYNTDLFDRTTIARLARRLALALEAIAADPDRRLSELTLLPEDELRQILEWSEGAPAPSAPVLVHDLVAAQAARTPEAPAVIGIDGEALSYRDLEDQAERLADHLRTLGAGPEERVAIALERSADQMVAVLAVLKTGASYVPVDPGYPEERRALMLEEARPAVVLASSCPPSPGDREGGAGRGAGGEGVLDQTAYILYTSGSTGRPKGVALHHAALANLIAWQLAATPGPWRTLQFTSLSFDVSFQEIFSTWAAGGALVLVSEETRRDPAALWQRLREERIERLFLPFAALQGLAEAARAERELPASLREVITAGEQLRITPAIVELFTRLGARLHNQYGPSETHVATALTLDQDPAAWPLLPPIGQPIDGDRVLILDRDGRPAPIGAPGEIFLGGVGVARGYFERPDLTAERFVPEGALGGARLYRTGDLGRWRPDGRIEFLGRADAQVKIRGFRVEPGEVEAALSSLPGVRSAAVVAREDRPGDRRLIAYVEGEGLDPRELRRLLAECLPDHMVPSVFLPVAAFPLTPSGKVDRRALARLAPERGAGARDAVAPRTPAEERLAGIWAEVLGVERVGATDSFFELGGHSLLGTQIVARVRSATGVDLPLRALFEAPVLADLALRIESASAQSTDRIPAAGGEGRRLAPLSFAQQRLWFFDRFEPGSAVYNLPMALRLQGRLDVHALASAFGAVVRRHEALRTTFEERGGEPVQVVAAAAEALAFELPVTDLSGCPGEAERLAREEARLPFDLSRGALLRARLLRLGEDEHVLLATMHHIVSDGWSLGVLVREIVALYEAFAAGRPSPLPPLPIQYADFAVWQRRRLAGAALEEQIRWWTEALAGAPQVLEVPADRPRPATQSFRGAQRPVVLPAELTEAVRGLSRRAGVTLFMTLLAAVQTLLGRMAGQDDLLIGAPVANRTRPEVEGLIGFFVNTLVLRGDLTGAPSFCALLGRVRAHALGAFAHQDLPFERLVEEMGVERSLSHHPLYQVGFALQNAPAGELRLPGLTLTPLAADSGTAKTDLLLSLAEAGPAGELAGVWEHATDLFDAPTLDRLTWHLATLLEAAAADPERRLHDLPLLTEAETAQLLCEWNDTGQGSLRADRLDRLFALQAARTPDAPALVSAGGILTYRELDERSSALALRLRTLGIGPERLVGLCLDETVERMVGVLGVFKAGGAYVPLDPSYPGERLALMLEDCGAPVVLTREGLRSVLPSTAAPVLCLDDPSDRSDPTDRPDLGLSGDHLAYVIYTSGSTGRPNGVMVEQRTIAAFVQQAAALFGCGPGDRFLQVASFSFDASVADAWTALTSGASLSIASREERVSGALLAEAVRRQGITHMCLLPSILAQLPAGELPSVRLVTSGGESCPPELAERWSPPRSPSRLLNVYGPTETTVFSTVLESAGGFRREPPIGRPIPGTRVYVLEPGASPGRPAPIGVPGLLWIGGAGLARGYVRRPELTAERFAPDPFASAPGGRLYRTGDLARWLPDGSLDFLGRLDHQVKVRGVRVELGEIEAALGSHPAVGEAAVLALGAADGRRIAAWVTPREGTSAPETAALRAFLRERLPEVMIPSVLTVLPALPLTPVGKVDHRALARLARRAETERAGADHVAPRTPTEELLAALWADLLGLSRVGAGDSFFELGGHSLLAARLASRVRDRWGIELPLQAVFEAPILADLAERIDATLREGVPPAPPLLPVELPSTPEGGRRAPVSFAQRRLWFLDQLEPGSAAYNMPVAVRLTGALNVGALAEALIGLIRRHETLRTRFEAVGGEPWQVIAPGAPFPLRVSDLSPMDPVARAAEAERLAREEAARPFDLAAGPLLRARLLRLGPEEHLLIAVLHHIVSDGWSMGVLVREMGALYPAAVEGRPSPLPPLPFQYADYAVWQRAWLAGGALEAQLRWWKEELAGAPFSLDLPTDRPRPPVLLQRGAEEAVELAAPLAAAVRALARQEGATLFMALLAAFQALLCRWTGERDVLVGSPVANRTRSEIEGLIGFFVNNLTLRGRLGGTFRDLLARARTAALGAYAHQDLPFERLVEELGVERARNRHPLYQMMLALQNTPSEPLRLPGLTLDAVPAPSGTAKTDLLLSFVETSDGPLRGAWEYDVDLFDAATMRRFTGHLINLLAGAVASPETPLAELPLLSGDERMQVLETWNRTAADFPREATVHGLFDEQAMRTPEAVAVVHGDERLTYHDLARRSERLAHRLLALGVRSEERVGLCSGRSLEMITALVGILKTGAAYLPLDPSSPPERLAWMLADAGATVLLAERRLLNGSEVPGDLRVLWLEDLEAGDEPPALPLPQVPATSLAYVMYTSGSTGKPKGVAVTHRNVIRLVRGADYASMGPEQAWLQFAPVSFDAATLEIWAPLLNGGRLVLFPGEKPSLDELGRAIGRFGVTSLWLTAGLFHQMVDHELESLRPLRQLLAGGDVVSPVHARRALEALPGLALIDGYGPTEGTTFTCTWRMTDPRQVGAAVPIGAPIANARVYVLDGRMQPVPVGVAGELWIGGEGLARGYLGRPDLTAERFVPDPFGRAGERLYRTGDRVRFRPDGPLEFLGRLAGDGQVKIRGFRVETGEVEAVLAGLPEVRSAAVAVREDAAGKALTAYVVPAAGESAGDLAARLQHALRERLSEPMIPSAWVLLDALPLTPNGKVDRRALPQPSADGPRAEYEAPRTPLEQEIVATCADLLGLDPGRIGIRDNFFDLGGHSLLATQLIARLHGRLGIEIPLRLLFDAPDLRAFAERITEREIAAAGAEDISALLDEMEGLSPEELRALLSGAGEQ